MELLRWRWGGTEMGESRHSGCDHQCCCFPSFSPVLQQGEEDGSCCAAPPSSLLSSLSLLSFSFSFFFLPALSLPCPFLSVSPLFLSKTVGLPHFLFQKILPALLFYAIFSSVFSKLSPIESVVCFSPSLKFCPLYLLVPPLVFISRGGEGHLTPVMAQGKVGDGSCWQGMVSCFHHHGGMGL